MSLSKESPKHDPIYPTIRTIVIEPDPELRVVLNSVLSVQDLAYIVYNASTVTEALEHFKQEHHDYGVPKLVIITAKMTGEELLSAIRIFKVINPYVKVISMGGWRSYECLMQLFQTGLCAYLHPHSEDSFLRYVAFSICYEGQYCLQLSMATTKLCVITYSFIELLHFEENFGFDRKKWNEQRPNRQWDF
jgi:DNA-binding NarL/FixJ family response regulator